MITFIAVCGHLFINILLGWTVLNCCSNHRNWAESVVVSLLCGIYLETLLVATLILLGIPLKVTVVLIIAGTLILFFIIRLRKGISIPKLSLGKVRWYEFLLLFTIGEKIVLLIWKLIQIPVFFDDAMTHWSLRARSLFGAVNWSLDPVSPDFLGLIRDKYYPLSTPIWRAVTAVLNGSWNDVIGRVDGLIFFMVIIASVWLAVWRFSQLRWLAAIAAFIISALPLQIWHAGAGYGDIAVEAFALASLAALLRREWFLAGILASGTAWAKNDGLFLSMPGLFIMALLLQFSLKENKNNKWFQTESWKNIFWYLLGVITLTPWFIFKYVYSLEITSESLNVSVHLDALKLLWQEVINGASHSIFWYFVFFSVVLTAKRMLQDRIGFALFGLFFIAMISIVSIFSFTDAYLFLVNVHTVHRSMLQFYGIATVTVMYGLWLNMKDSSLR
jgi:hypothetical protein